jgi:3-deoxy-7-phosphoheptulonate synthase
MLVVMQEGAEDAQVQTVIDRLVSMGFTVHRSTGVKHVLLGGVGPVEEFDPADFEVMSGVKECHRIISPYKLASRHFRPGGTVIRATAWLLWRARAVSRMRVRLSRQRRL